MFLRTPKNNGSPATRSTPIHSLIRSHFKPTAPEALTVTERKFPDRVRADAHRAIQRLLAEGPGDGRQAPTVDYFGGVRKNMMFMGLDFTELTTQDAHDPAVAVPPVYEEIDIGEPEPARCLRTAFWLLRFGSIRLALLIDQSATMSKSTGLRFQIASTGADDAEALVRQLLARIEADMRRADSYRGKVLSLETDEDYSGKAGGLTVHRLPRVEREQVVLPARTLELLERNVRGFVELRPRLHRLGLSTKKGLLFYGPPGTGKTHTIRYLAGTLPGHTTLIITAEQVGLLGEYMTLARLLQPSLVVIEDVDLIARDRQSMKGPCEEAMLNKLLNEMDGLRNDTEVLFLLTTNRPESLEAALAGRPGRVDQAIEFPLPDDDGRRKLIRLYAGSAELPDDVLDEAVRRTEGVSAAFLKELLRRAAQFHLERSDTDRLESADIDAALDELLVRGGSLNRLLLGATGE